MIDLQKFVFWLADLVKDKFFGKITLSIESGIITSIKKEEVLKDKDF
jgi:hypothetical protein